MVEWSRNTPWRQGQVLPEAAAIALNLSKDSIVVVISHDCDLTAAPDKEPVVEVICGRPVDDEDHGNFAHAKVSRTLHISFPCGEQTQWVELTATKKMSIPKEKLAEFRPRTDLCLEPAGNAILQRWLAARYRRAAFPDAFEKRLKATGLEGELTRILKHLGEHIVAIFFDVDDGREAIRTEVSDTYALRIYLLHSTEPDPEKAQAAAEEACRRIEVAFQKKLLAPTGKWTLIELCDCSAISDEALSYKQSALFKQWRLDQLSLREYPPRPMLET